MEARQHGAITSADMSTMNVTSAVKTQEARVRIVPGFNRQGIEVAGSNYTIWDRAGGDRRSPSSQPKARARSPLDVSQALSC